MAHREMSVTRRGGPEVLQLRTLEPTPPGPTDVLLRVAAAGVSFGDVLLRIGLIPGGPRPPFVPGFDVTGVVEAVGSEVVGIAAGKRFTALLRYGGYTEWATVPADRLVPVPDGVSDLRVAATALNYFVAYQMLHRVADVRGGQHVLVHGAAGGVGSALVQLAALAGAYCLGTSSRDKRSVVQGLGARHIDYRNEDYLPIVRALPERGVDAVFDPLGGTSFQRSYRALRRGGILVGYGQSQAVKNGTPSRPLAIFGFLGGLFAPRLIPDGRRTTFYNAWSLERKQPEAYQADLREVLALLAAGKIRPVVARTLPLATAARAHELLEQSAVSGKIVLSCGPEGRVGG